MLSQNEIVALKTRLSRMTDIEFLEFELNLMDIILEKKMDEGKIVFSEVENGLLN